MASNGDADAPWGAPLARRPRPVLDDPCVHPFSDEPQDPLVRNAVLEELLQPAVIKLVKKSLMSASSTQFTFFRSIPTLSASSA